MPDPASWTKPGVVFPGQIDAAASLHPRVAPTTHNSAPQSPHNRRSKWYRARAASQTR